MRYREWLLLESDGQLGALIEQLTANLNDPNVRLVLADWCEDNGESDVAEALRFVVRRTGSPVAFQAAKRDVFKRLADAGYRFSIRSAEGGDLHVHHGGRHFEIRVHEHGVWPAFKAESVKGMPAEKDLLLAVAILVCEVDLRSVRGDDFAVGRLLASAVKRLQSIAFAYSPGHDPVGTARALEQVDKLVADIESLKKLPAGDKALHDLAARVRHHTNNSLRDAMRPVLTALGD